MGAETGEAYFSIVFNHNHEAQSAISAELPHDRGPRDQGRPGAQKTAHSKVGHCISFANSAGFVRGPSQVA